MNHVDLLSLFYAIITLFLAIITLKFIYKLLFTRMLVKLCKTMSPIIAFYFIYLFIWALTSIINSIHIIAFWRPEENAYNAKALFWLALFPNNFICFGTFIEFFLCLERCLIILYPFQFTLRYRYYFGYFGIVFTVILVIQFYFTSPLFSFAPIVPYSQCRSLSCFIITLLATSMLVTKFVSISMNFGCGVILFLLIKIRLTSYESGNKNLHKCVLKIVASTVFFELIPNIILWTFKLFGPGQSIVEYAGSYPSMLSGLNILLCASIYSKAIIKTIKKESVTISHINGGVNVF